MKSLVTRGRRVSSVYRYAAFIRAINVGGTSVIRMADLKKHFERYGLEHVSTYIQTGNVIFSTDNDNPDELSRELSERLGRVLKRPTDVFVYNREYLKNVVSHYPFDLNDNALYRQVLFLADKPKPANVRALMAMEPKQYRFQCSGSVVYYAYLKSYAGKRRMIDFEKVLGVRGTSRTLNVVNKLIELMSSENERSEH